MKKVNIITKIMLCISFSLCILPLHFSNIHAESFYNLGSRTVTHEGSIYTYDSRKTYEAKYTVSVTIYNDPSGRYSGYTLNSYNLSNTEQGATYLEDFRVVKVNATGSLVTFMISARFGGFIGSDYKGNDTFSISTADPYLLKGVD